VPFKVIRPVTLIVEPAVIVPAIAAGVIARAVANASKAKANFFIIPPGVALAGICPAYATCRGLATGRTTVPMVHALNFKERAMPSTGILTKILCALPEANQFDLDLRGPGVKRLIGRTMQILPAQTTDAHFYLCTLSTKVGAFRFSDLRHDRLANAQILAHLVIKKVLFWVEVAQIAEWKSSQKYGRRC
jgi:hypothetical protein